MTDTLSKLFGSSTRVKLLRLFLFNPKASFKISEAAERAQGKPADVRRELVLLEQIKLIKHIKRGGAMRYSLNNEFAYVEALQSLLLNAPEFGADLYARVRRTGAIKLIVVCGIFVNESEAPLDALIVGDRVKERTLRDKVRKLEAEMGKEIRYALLTQDSFFYRLNVNDHLVKDVFDYPHRIIHDKLNVGLK